MVDSGLLVDDISSLFGPIVGVGGEAYPVNRLAILAPVIAVLAGIAGASVVLRRHRADN